MQRLIVALGTACGASAGPQPRTGLGTTCGTGVWGHGVSAERAFRPAHIQVHDSLFAVQGASWRMPKEWR